MSAAWNPRYLAYCRATGEPDPDRAAERDRARYPGGHMVGYIVWIQDRWREWERANGRTPWGNKTDAAHAAFDQWLSEWTSPDADGAA